MTLSGAGTSVLWHALGPGKRSVGQSLEFPQDQVHTEQSIVASSGITVLAPKLRGVLPAARSGLPLLWSTVCIQQRHLGQRVLVPSVLYRLYTSGLPPANYLSDLTRPTSSAPSGRSSPRNSGDLLPLRASALAFLSFTVLTLPASTLCSQRHLALLRSPYGCGDMHADMEQKPSPVLRAFWRSADLVADGRPLRDVLLGFFVSFAFFAFSSPCALALPPSSTLAGERMRWAKPAPALFLHHDDALYTYISSLVSPPCLPSSPPHLCIGPCFPRLPGRHHRLATALLFPALPTGLGSHPHSHRLLATTRTRNSEGDADASSSAPGRKFTSKELEE
ncbi:hypothetical protein B0H13DRAFT_2422652 [Mycena leptocephala]|nr:hypothetical protein B0H13DRAFT_2422652 [Mycena leptocephala]